MQVFLHPLDGDFFFSVLTWEKAQRENIWNLQVCASSVKLVHFDNQEPNVKWSLKHFNVLFTQHSMTFVFHKEIKLYVKVCDVLNTTGCPIIFLSNFWWLHPETETIYNGTILIMSGRLFTLKRDLEFIIRITKSASMYCSLGSPTINVC